MPEHRAYAKGLWNATCDICGCVFRSDKLRLAWDNSMRCEADWEPRHPQDSVRGIKDDQATDWARPWVPSLAQCDITSLLPASGIGSSQFTIALADVAKFPAVSAGINHYLATLSDADSFEIVLVHHYSGAGNTVNVFQRGMLGTTAQEWPIGTLFTATTVLIPD